MSKQINIYSTQNGVQYIYQKINELFDSPITVPFFITKNESKFEEMLYIESGQQWISRDIDKKNIFYRKYDNILSKRVNEYVLVECLSPVLEFSLPSINANNEYCPGRLYCCSQNTEFVKIITKLFRTIKKEFRYVRKYNMYMSPDIDLDIAIFANNRIIKKEDMAPILH